MLYTSSPVTCKYRVAYAPMYALPLHLQTYPPPTFPLLTVLSPHLTPLPSSPPLPSPSPHLQVSPASRSMLTSTAPSVEDMLREKRPEEAILQLLRRRISLSHSSRSNDWEGVKVEGVELERERVESSYDNDITFTFLHPHTLTLSLFTSSHTHHGDS